MREIWELEAETAFATDDASVWIQGRDRAIRRLDLAHGDVIRLARVGREARLLAGTRSAAGTWFFALVDGDQVVLHEVGQRVGRAPLPAVGGAPVRAALVRVGAAVMLVVGAGRSVRGFALVGQLLQQRWVTSSLQGLVTRVIARPAGGHAAVVTREGVVFFDAARGREVDRMPTGAGLAGACVDRAWRHWLIWRAGERAVHRVGRDVELSRWRFERVAIPGLPTCAACMEDGRAFVVGADDRAGWEVPADTSEEPSSIDCAPLVASTTLAVVERAVGGAVLVGRTPEKRLIAARIGDDPR